MPEITSRMHRCQFGALPCRGTKEAIHLVNEVMERFRSMARHKKSSQRPLRKMAVLQFDLEKGFDCVPRDKAFSELAKLAESDDLKLIMEDFHRGTRFLRWNSQQETVCIPRSAARITGRSSGVPGALQRNHGRGQGYERK